MVAHEPPNRTRDSARWIASAIGNREFVRLARAALLLRSPAVQGLTAPRFRANQDLEDCFNDEARLTMGGIGKEGTRKVQSGDAVMLVQTALADLETTSAGRYLEADQVTGTYNHATWEAVNLDGW